MKENKTDTAAFLELLIQKLERKKERLLNKSKKFSWYRLFIFIAGISLSLILYFIFGSIAFGAAILISITVFGIVTKFHNSLIDSIRKHSIWLEIKKAHYARLNLDWDKIPKQNTEFSNPDFIENDLNIIGSQSLHHLINTSVTPDGSYILRHWLSNSKPNLDEILYRQSLIKELTALTRFRDKLALSSTLVSQNEFKSKQFLLWLNKNNSRINIKHLLRILILLAPVNLILILLNYLGVLPQIWVISSCIYFGIYLFNYKKIEHTFDDAELMFDELKKLFRVIRHLEKYNYGMNFHLKELCKPFLTKEKPSNQLDGIRRVIEFLRLRGNPLVWWLFILLFPVDYYFTYKLEKYKMLVADKLPIWLDTWYNLEALCSLANFAYLNPDYSFPVLYSKKNGEKNLLTAKQIGHPLIPYKQKICNDFSFKNYGEMALITGSNMSGKSTFLRTIGINLCLAYSGGPVNANSFETILFRLFTCIKVSDSVIDGISYFYSEVKRLKKLLDEFDLNDDKPVFFLIDEIFKGTNNFERLEGSKSFIKYIAGKNGNGLVSTHDLELVKITEEISSIKNYHFKEEVIDNKMKFDYLIHEGPCPTTNALKIMKMEGLPVDI